MLTRKERMKLDALAASVRQCIIQYEGAFTRLAMQDFEDGLRQTAEAERLRYCRRYLRVYRRLGVRS